MQLIFKPQDKPKLGQVIVFAIQQLLAIMAATLVVPVIIGNGMQPAAALSAQVSAHSYTFFSPRVRALYSSVLPLHSSAPWVQHSQARFPLQ